MEEECERTALHKRVRARIISKAPARSKGSDNSKSICPRQFSDNFKNVFNVLHSSYSSCSECSLIEGQDHEANLNTYGVLIHIWADVLRTALMIVIGVLVEARVLKNPQVVDLTCSLVVCGMVLIGSMVLIQKVWVQTQVLLSADRHCNDSESNDPTVQQDGAS